MIAYQVHTPVFEGPLELLLELIEKRKLEINKISLASVTDDFLNYVKTMTELKLGDISQFILVAATRVLIKSKSLLPMMELTTEEEGSIKDLEERLRRFQIIKSTMPALKTMFGQFVIFNRVGVPFMSVFAPDKNTNQTSLQEAGWRVINEMPKREFLPQVPVKKVISLQEMMQSLISRIEKGLQLSFKEFAKGDFKDKKEEKVHVVVGFLALLELVHQGLIQVFQDSLFNDITIDKPSIAEAVSKNI